MDYTCTMHGKLMSEHMCLYCCLCFEDLTPEECWVDEEGQGWDVCRPCREMEVSKHQALGRTLKPYEEDK